MKIAVTGIIHQKSTEYYNEYIKSLYNQTYKDFDLLVFNQNIYSDRGLYLDSSLSLSQAKKFTIDYLKEEDYDIVIFTDTDDFFDSTYVESLLEGLKEEPISFTDLCVYYSNSDKIQDYLSKCGVPDIIDHNFLADKNCIGWGNSAIKLNLYNDMDNFEEDFSKCDWWFFRNLMQKNNCKAKFIRKSLVFYRQHRNNLLGANIKDFKLWGEK